VKYGENFPHNKGSFLNKSLLTKSFSTTHIHVMDIDLDTLNVENFELLENQLNKFTKKWIVVTLRGSLYSSKYSIYFIY
jgi:hypothetical protein